MDVGVKAGDHLFQEVVARECYSCTNKICPSIHPAETPVCWTLKIQTKAVLADNYPPKCPNCLLSANMARMSAYLEL